MFPPRASAFTAKVISGGRARFSGFVHCAIEQRLVHLPDIEQPRDETREHARDRNQQLRLFRRRKRRPCAIALEALRECSVETVQVCPECSIERREPLGLEQVPIPKAAQPEGEISPSSTRTLPFPAANPKP